MESVDAKQSFDEGDAVVPEDNTNKHVEPKTIIVKGLNEKTTSETIRCFIETMTQNKVLGIAHFGKKSAIVTLENISNFIKVQQRVEEETLDDKKLTIVKCPLSLTILVSGLTPDTTADALKFKFSVPAVGGKVSHVLLHENNSQAIVTFEDSSVIKKIIGNTWKLNSAVLKVDTYQAFLEKQVPVELARTAAEAGSFEPCSDSVGKLQEFLNEGSVSSETFFCQHEGYRRHILEHRKDELEMLKSELKQYCVTIEAAKVDDELLISGTENGRKCVRFALHNMISSLTIKEMTIHQSGLKKIFASEKVDSLVEAIEQEFHCSIEHQLLPGTPENDQEDFESSEESFEEGGDDEEQICSPPRLYVSFAGSNKISCYNVDITWKTGNIVLENADVLVSSIPGQLYDIFRSAAGPDLLPKEDSIEMGDIAVAPGFNHQCKYVIYTRCPRYDGMPNGPAEMALRSIVQKCLQEAFQLNATSIAFPIIGTRGLGFDKYTACRIMITEVISVTCGWGLTSLTDIRFVVFDKDVGLANAFEYEFLDVSGQSYQGEGGAVFIRRHNYTAVFGWPFGYGYKLYRAMTQPVPYNIPFPYALGCTTNMYGNVEVHVLHGDPHKFIYEKSDAIVNFFYIQPRRKPFIRNELTWIISRVAGQALRAECENLSTKAPGTALVTESGSLNAEHIIHIIIDTPDAQNIQRSIEECFEVADRAGYRFISIPFQVSDFNLLEGEVAQVTFKTLATTCQRLQNLRLIRMVVFDKKNVLVFQQMQQYYGSGVVKRPNESILSDTSSGWPSSDTTASKVTFQMIGENNGLENAKSALEECISESYEARQVISEYIANLDRKQRHMLTTKAGKLDVTIKGSEEPHVLVIQGNREDVDAIEAALKEEINEITLYDTIRWQYQFPDEDAQYFDRKSNSSMEKTNGSEESRATVRIEGDAFDLDLQTYTGIGQATGRKISIKRTTLEGFPIPAKWSPMPLENGKEKTVHLVTLSPDSHEYKKVADIFGSASDPRFPAFFELSNLFRGWYREIRIQRIQNPHLYQQYIAHKKKLEKDNGRKFNERRLFHGTMEKNVKAINTQGFNRTFCGVHGTLLGRGVYFAESAMYSAGFTEPNQTRATTDIFILLVF